MSSRKCLQQLTKSCFVCIPEEMTRGSSKKKLTSGLTGSGWASMKSTHIQQHIQCTSRSELLLPCFCHKEKLFLISRSMVHLDSDAKFENKLNSVDSRGTYRIYNQLQGNG